jgi:predicted enzyme related to lactoylglutathione lyase
VIAALDVNLFCRDIERQLAFYQALLGLPERVAARSPIYRALAFGTAELGFNAHDAYALLGLAGREGEGVRAFATFNLDRADAVDRLAGLVGPLGGTLVKPPYRTYYGAWQAVAADPEANVFRLNHRPP